METTDRDHRRDVGLRIDFQYCDITPENDRSPDMHTSAEESDIGSDIIVQFREGRER